MATCSFVIDSRDQRVQREETWNTVPMTKNSRTIDPNKIPKISKVRLETYNFTSH